LNGHGVKRLLWIVFGLVVVIALASAGGYWYVTQPYKGYAGEEVFVNVPAGSSVNAIGRQLVGAGVVRDQAAFRAAMRLRGGAGTLRAGEYRFSEAMTPAEVIDKLARGDVFLRPLTFPEGLTIAEMATIYERQGFGTAAEFVAAAKDEALIKELDASASDLEGYLYPETYALPRRARASDLVAQMVARFKAVLTPALRKEAEARNLTVRQIVTIASLVEKETAKADERPLVSAVYQNRLRIGMGMQCDPTVIYALQRDGKYTGNLTREDLRYDSPYNTYRYAGLPPGPIAAPGLPSIEAAVRPATATFIYFVSKNDGSHVFATTLDEHNRNVREHQIEYFRNKRAQAAREAAKVTASASSRPGARAGKAAKEGTKSARTARRG
jgi:UPF0755 protein